MFWAIARLFLDAIAFKPKLQGRYSLRNSLLKKTPTQPRQISLFSPQQKRSNHHELARRQFVRPLADNRHTRNKNERYRFLV
jgi:hypothetical protein